MTDESKDPTVREGTVQGTPSIPQKLGRYAIDRLLGSGAMGHVYLARDAELDRPVAIKTIRDIQYAEPSFVERFRNEARAAARLRHPAIVPVFDVGEDPAVGPFLVFEYVRGVSLHRRIRESGALSLEEVRRLADELGGALDAAHAAGIIHRDIKPDNIMLDSDGGARLTDFGIARIPNAGLTGEGQFLGTPCYAAPETLREADYSIRSDVFSFAAVLYEALVGERAFPGLDAVAVAHRVVHTHPTPPSKRNPFVPKSVDRVIAKGLHKAPVDRYPTAQALVSGLNEALEQTSGPWKLMGLGGAVVALVVGGGAFAGGLVGPGFQFGDTTVLNGDAGAEAGAGVANHDGGVRDTGLTEADSGPTDAALDSGLVDASDPFAAMSSFEREEAAKDALTKARRLLHAGDTLAARSLLERAAQLDPGNDDVEATLKALLPEP